MWHHFQGRHNLGSLYTMLSVGGQTLSFDTHRPLHLPALTLKRASTTVSFTSFTGRFFHEQNRRLA